MTSSGGHPPAGCTLAAPEAAAQLADWRKLLQSVSRIDAIDRGSQLFFPRVQETAVRALAARESACCAFLTIDVDAEGPEVSVEITSEQEGARKLLDLMTGGTSRDGSR